MYHTECKHLRRILEMALVIDEWISFVPNDGLAYVIQCVYQYLHSICRKWKKNKKKIKWRKLLIQIYDAFNCFV